MALLAALLVLLVLVLVLLPPTESLLEQETRSMAPSKRKPKLHCPATMLGSTLAVHRPMHTAADYHSKSEPARLVTLTAWVVMLLELLMLVLLPVLLPVALLLVVAVVVVLPREVLLLLLLLAVLLLLLLLLLLAMLLLLFRTVLVVGGRATVHDRQRQLSNLLLLAVLLKLLAVLPPTLRLLQKDAGPPPVGKPKCAATMLASAVAVDSPMEAQAPEQLLNSPVRLWLAPRATATELAATQIR